MEEKAGRQAETKVLCGSELYQMRDREAGEVCCEAHIKWRYEASCSHDADGADLSCSPLSDSGFCAHRYIRRAGHQLHFVRPADKVHPLSAPSAARVSSFCLAVFGLTALTALCMTSEPGSSIFMLQFRDIVLSLSLV